MVITLTVSGFTTSEVVWLQTNVNKFWMDRWCGSPVLDCYWQRLLTPNQELATYQYSEQSHVCFTGNGLFDYSVNDLQSVRQGLLTGCQHQPVVHKERDCTVRCKSWDSYSTMKIGWLLMIAFLVPESARAIAPPSGTRQWVCIMLILPQHKVR